MSDRPLMGAASPGEKHGGRTVPLHIHSHLIGGRDSESGELGVVNEQRADGVLEAVHIVSRGEIYDLDPGRWSGMPHSSNHPPFVITTYRTPSGLAHSGGLGGTESTAYTTELMIGTAHTGTHIDALAHVSCGAPAEYHGGYTEQDILSDFGPTRADAATIPPIVCRGVLADVAGIRGVDVLPADHEISAAELEEALAVHDEAIQPGDAVLIRTGYMRHWITASPAVLETHARPGIGADAARFIGNRGACVAGADTEAIEIIPSNDPLVLPAHVELIQRRGVHIVENVYLEDLARDGVGAFLFVCLPLRILGATGSMVRPIAVV